MYFYAYAPLKFLEFLERTGAARSRNNQGHTKKQDEKTKRKNQGHTSNQIIRTTKKQNEKTRSKKPYIKN